MKTIRVLLADDHTLFRAGIRMLLDRMSGVEIAGEACNGREIFQILKSERVDVVLMDIAMPELNGLEATSRLAREYPWVKVIVLSMYATPDYVVQALRAGATGYLLKDAATAELEMAVRAVARGETHLAAAVSKTVVTDYLRRISGRGQGFTEEVSPAKALTPRQREILQLIAEGKTTKEIAAALNLSENTIETHRRHLMERLNVHDVAGLVRYAIHLGLVQTDL
ncbi:MAG: response regulator [Candidatus Binatia bacterium]